MNVIFTCGGTGGHINPAIAVANTLRERHPDCKILFIGAEGEMEERLVPKAGYELRGLPSSNLRRNLSWDGIRHNVRGAKKILSALKQCKVILREFQPDVVVGTGGYASFPALYEGAKMGIPTCVHESNAVPGLATKLVAKRADRILVNYAECADRYPDPGKVQVVGMPVDKGFVFADREEARKELGLDQRPLVVSAFGSLGARDMNKVIAEVFRLERDMGCPWQHIHATGRFGWEWMPEYVKNQGVDLEACPGIDMREYIYNMPTLMAAADVIISRAGAASCNEIAAAGLPCIMIPSPNVTAHHQERNAQVMADRGAVVLLPEPECTGKRLFDEIDGLLRDPSRRQEMSKALRRSVILDSTDRICDIIEELAKK